MPSQAKGVSTFGPAPPPLKSAPKLYLVISLRLRILFFSIKAICPIFSHSVIRPIKSSTLSETGRLEFTYGAFSWLHLSDKRSSDSGVRFFNIKKPIPITKRRDKIARKMIFLFFVVWEKYMDYLSYQKNTHRYRCFLAQFLCALYYPITITPDLIHNDRG